MPSQITSQQYGQAVLEHIQSGSYPESEEIISAELPPSALKEISQQIEQAKEDVKIRIRKTSKDSAPDIDGWISQAKQLRVDIQKSQEIAWEVNEKARQGERLEERVNDATNKVGLLNGEIAFNESLGAKLEKLRAIQRTLELVQRAAFDAKLAEAVELLGQLDDDSKSLPVPKSTRISDVLEAKIADLQNHVREMLTAVWDRHIIIDPAKSSIQVSREAEGPSVLNLESVVDALSKLHSYEDTLQPLCRSFESLIILPRLHVRSDGSIKSLRVDGEEVRLSGPSSDLSAQSLFHDLGIVVDFLHNRFPPSVCDPLASFLMPRLVSRLISTWLVSAVPEDLDSMEEFEDTLSLVKQFGEKLDDHQWPGQGELSKWTDGIPSVWLRKRQELSLDRVRKLFSQGLGDTETVERTETQVLSRNDEVFASNGVGDDWNAGWSDEETSPTAKKMPKVASAAAQGEHEEDVSAWGLDDDKENVAAHDEANSSRHVDEDAEAWGWGDDDEGEENGKPSHAATSLPKSPKANGKPQADQQADREVTLRATYTITSLPREILEIINQVILDSIRLETSDYASLPIASAAPDLLSLPGLILAMYRASSSISYSQHPSGQMFLYNDSVWLLERLHCLHSEHTTASGRRIPSRMAHNLKLLEHTSALESYGKRAYAKEMESQRTIITDLLDGAQGFVNCTEHPFAEAADLAIASTVDRLRQLHREWNQILSHSALLQSLGSLLATVINKIIIDIEDMSDISQEETQQLAAYCNRIATLEDLFSPVEGQGDPARSGDQDIIPMTALYTPHWLKFQYLANILESSLIDIKYLWTEGELGLEFDTEELVDLVVALFADTTHRRTAVAEIRGRRGVR